MSATAIQRHRHNAAERQGYCCKYCQFPMWEGSPEAFAATHNISLREARHFQCTAEHVIAKSDGGLATADNIVAACLFCNRKRHQRKKPKAAAAYVAFVQARVARGAWHHRHLHSRLFLDQSYETAH